MTNVCRKLIYAIFWIYFYKYKIQIEMIAFSLKDRTGKTWIDKKQ